jgi:hypothetical protein
VWNPMKPAAPVIKTLFFECGVLLSWLPLERHKTE